ncbi:MAG: class IV lanthionine synthetase LanL [Nitrolancea sp.]
MSSLHFLPSIQQACASSDDRRAETTWRVEERDNPDEPWIVASPSDSVLNAQGWKLHVSATLSSAVEVLARSLPVLITADVTFKVAKSLEALELLNQGDAGRSQIGKFITVYPRDDEQAVDLAVKLDRATDGLTGPTVPSDRPLRPGSRVSYRYGGFKGQIVQLPSGVSIPVIRTFDGDLAHDSRGERYQAPPWVTDPFREAGVTLDGSPRSPLIGDRYLVAETIFRSPRGRVYLAADTVEGRVCVLKQGARYALEDRYGRDARQRIQCEYDVLNSLGPSPHWPAVYDLVEERDDLYLVMEDVSGDTLEQRVARHTARAQFVPERQIIRWGIELAMILEKVHAAGYVYRDLKSPNILVGSDDELRLIDFELAHEIGNPDYPVGRGTRGYASTQQARRDPATVLDDVYGLGALLYFMATGAEPSWAPDPHNLLVRPARILNPSTSPALERVIERCLELEPGDRYPNMPAMRAALEALATGQTSVRAVADAGRVEAVSQLDRGQFLGLARRLADSLVADAQNSPGEPGWISSHAVSRGQRALDVNTGASGAILALAEAVDVFEDPAHREMLGQTAHWLAHAGRHALQPMPGLYIGDSGIALALLRAGQILDDQTLIDEARKTERTVASMPHASPDLFNGTAGRLRMHLAFWDAIGDQDPLDHAQSCGDYIVESAEHEESGGIQWTIPDGFDGLSGTTYLGYAHGTAGIADALLDLYDVTREYRYLEPVLAAARLLGKHAIPVLEDYSGINWPDVLDGELGRAFWCHGATGVGRFFLRAAELNVYVPGLGLAKRAARTIAHGPLGVGPSQCHGLAGNLEFLLDLYQATGETAFLEDAMKLAQLLLTFKTQQDGRLFWLGDSFSTVSPDYMVGYAGVLPTLLRLSDPDHRPHQLSRAGFRYRKSATQPA